MKVNVIEKQCLAKTGLAIEFSNNECASIEHVADVINNAIEKAIDKAKKNVVDSKKNYKQATDIDVTINLNTAMRITWLLGNFITNRESALFGNADNMALVTLAEINGENKPTSEEGEQSSSSLFV